MEQRYQYGRAQNFLAICFKPGKYYQPWKDACPIEKCPKCGAGEFHGAFDTWMDSSISPLFISKYNKDDEFFAKTYPAR